MTDSRDTTSDNIKEDRRFDPKTGQGYINLEDYEDTDQTAQRFMVAQKQFLIHSIGKLLKLSYGEFFRQPANYLNPTLKKIDLKMIRSKIHESRYLSVEDIKADFDLMVDASSVGNGTQHALTDQARKLRTVFEAYMSEIPGSSYAGSPGPWRLRPRYPHASFIGKIYTNGRDVGDYFLKSSMMTANTRPPDRTRLM